MRYFEDPILGKGRAADVSGGTGSADYVGGTRITIGGETISFVNSATIQNVTGNSVTLEPDTAYKITATTSAVTLNANVPAAGQWAYEGHAEIFVAGTGYIVTGANVVLANPLEPDAVNNCVLRFHDGTCIIDVEDHVYGYVVTSISGTTQGTLPYGITSATSNYIAFDATTNGSNIDLSGSTASAEKHLVGNGYTSTTLTGAVDCGTSKFTVANLGLANVQITGGTMTLGDAYIPSGSTVAVSGGGLAVEKVTGAGSESIVNLGGTNVDYPNGGVALVDGVLISGGYASNGGAFRFIGGDFYANNTIITGNTATALRGGALYTYGGSIRLTGCTVSKNGSASDIQGGGIAVFANGTVMLSNCNVSDNIGSGDISVASSLVVLSGGTYGNIILGNGKAELSAENKVDSIVQGNSAGSVTLTSGAILDLTGNTNDTPIAPGGGITFEAGGATVLYDNGGEGASASYMIDNITFPAGATLKNNGTVTANGSSGDYAIIKNKTAIVSGGRMTGTVIVYNNGILNLSSTQMVGTVLLDSYYGIGGSAIIAGDCTIATIAKNVPAGTTPTGIAIISSGASINLTNTIAPGGGITVLAGGCTVNGNVIPAGTYTSIDSNGQPT